MSQWGGFSPRRLIRQLFTLRDLPVPPLVPLVASLAGRVGGVSREQFWSDPESMAVSHRRCRELLGYPVVLPALDPGLELTAADALALPPVGDGISTGKAAGPSVPGRAGVYLEALGRLKASLGEQATLAASVTGPWTLAKQLASTFPDAGDAVRMPSVFPLAEAISLGMARRAGEASVDITLVVEEYPFPSAPSEAGRLAAAMEAIWNTLRYYNSWPVLTVIQGGLAGFLPEWPGLGPGGVLFLNPPKLTASQEWLESCRELRDRRGAAVGFGIETSGWTGDPETVRRSVTAVRDVFGCSGWFLSTAGEIPAGTPIEAVQAGLKAITGE